MLVISGEVSHIWDAVLQPTGGNDIKKPKEINVSPRVRNPGSREFKKNIKKKNNNKKKT